MLTVGSQVKGLSVDLDYQGQGVIKHEGYVIFVKGLLDQEEAIVEITKLRKKFGEAKIIEIIKKNPNRRDDPESVLGSCDMIHMSEDKQLFWQKKITEETLKKITGLDLKINDILTDNKPRNYRNKSVFHVMESRVLTLGLYEKEFYKLIKVDSFSLADQATNDMIKVLNASKIMIDPAILKYVVCRTNPQGEILLTLGAKSSDFTGLESIIRLLKPIKNMVGLTLNIMDDQTSILGKSSYTLLGENRIKEPLGEIEIYLNDRSFYQINPPVIEKAYQLMKSQMKKGQTVIDSYSGVGSIGFYLSDKASHVTMIESNPEASEQAQMTKDKYGYQHIDVILERTENIIQDYDADILIVDPPRNGLLPEFIDKILLKKYQQIFYLSCDVKTLARDLLSLHDIYEIESIYSLKMFYQTSSLETLVFLNKMTQN